MKYLGIDFGEKRIGIAVSDIEAKMAFPKVVLENSAKIVEDILAKIEEYKAEVVVIGESKNYKGEDNKINPAIIKFKLTLEKALEEKNKSKAEHLDVLANVQTSPIPVYLEPEFMTSMQVEKLFGKNEMLDASAASIILQSFLDKEKNKQEKKAIEKSNRISIDDFAKVEMKVGKILAVEEIPGSDKLLKCVVDFAESEPRQILSGIKKYFPDISVLIGKKVAYVTNLEPRKMMGLESNGMVMAVHSGDVFALMEIPDSIEEGTKIG